MGKRTKAVPQSPDLFEAGRPQGRPVEASSSSENAAAARPYMLPGDLASALKYLTAEELHALSRAVRVEEHRRSPVNATQDSQALQPPAPATSADKIARAMKAPASSRPRPPRPTPAALEPQELTKSRINVIRAAFKAGVKPTTIARQFGVSQAAVRKALERDYSG